MNKHDLSRRWFSFHHGSPWSLSRIAKTGTLLKARALRQVDRLLGGRCTVFGGDSHCALTLRIPNPDPTADSASAHAVANRFDNPCIAAARHDQRKTAGVGIVRMFFLTLEGSFHDVSIRTGTSPGPGTGVGISLRCKTPAALAA